MPVITVDMWAGRGVEEKRALVQELTDAYVRTTGGKPEGVYVVIRDVPKENWGMAGELASDRFPD